MQDFFYINSKKILSVLAASLCFIFVSSSVKSSDFLLESTANKKYANFSTCLKSAGNFFTLCIDELQDFIIAENKLIRNSNTDKSKDRLRKVVKYLKQSTDIFIDEAYTTNDPTDFERASSAARFLSKLSSEYKSEYQNFISQASARKKGRTVSLALENYFKTVEANEPSIEIVEKLIQIALPIYDSLDDDLRSKLDRFFSGFVDRYVVELELINQAIVSSKVPDDKKLKYRYETYEMIIAISQIDPRSIEISKLKAQIGEAVSNHFKAIQLETNQLNKKFLAGEKLDSAQVDMQVEYINYFFELSSLISKHASSAFDEVPVFSDSDLNNYSNHQDFYLKAVSAQQAVDRNLFSEGIKILQTAIQVSYQDSMEIEIIRRINTYAATAITYFGEIFDKDDVIVINLLLNFPLNYLDTNVSNLRLTALDRFVSDITYTVKKSANDGNHDAALEKLSQLADTPNFLQMYEDEHKAAKVYVLDSYAQELFQSAINLADAGDHTNAFNKLSDLGPLAPVFIRYQTKLEAAKIYVLDSYAQELYNTVSYLLETDEYDQAISALSTAESIPDYLEHHQTMHDQVLEDARKRNDAYWSLKILPTIKVASISEGLEIINTKIYGNETKQAASSEIIKFATDNSRDLVEKFGFEQHLNELNHIQAKGLLTQNDELILRTSIKQTFRSWVLEEVKNSNIFSAAKLIYETDNDFSEEDKTRLIDDLIIAANQSAKNDPQLVINGLSSTVNLTKVPTNIRDKFIALMLKVGKQWSNDVITNGITSCNDYNALEFGLNAKTDISYIFAPPIGGPAQKNQYYRWYCNDLTTVYSSDNFACEFGGRIFVVDGVKQSFPERPQQRQGYSIIGKYNRNEKNIFGQLLPVLEDAYVASCF